MILTCVFIEFPLPFLSILAYSIIFETGSQPQAGTNASIYYRFFGDLNATNFMEAKGGSFDKGR